MIYKKSAVQLFENHPCLYILAFGFVSAKITNKLVVSQTYFFFSLFIIIISLYLLNYGCALCFLLLLFLISCIKIVWRG